MQYTNLLVDGQVVDLSRKKASGANTYTKQQTAGKKREKDLGPRGCANCPCNRTPAKKIGHPSIISNQKKNGIVIGLAPYKDEQKAQRAFVGKAGVLLWDTLKSLGINRDDVHIQNTVRCCPMDYDDLYRVWSPRTAPTELEFHCCSLLNDEAKDLFTGKVNAVLILGEEAAKRWLGRAYRKDKTLFWHDEWKAYVIVAEHPAYFLRRNDTSSWRFYQWKDKLRAFSLAMESAGRWGYVMSRPFRGLSQPVETVRFLSAAKKYSIKHNSRVSMDIEEGWVDGEYRTLMLSVCYGQWTSAAGFQYKAASIILDHPENKVTGKAREQVKEHVRKFVSDSTIPKIMHHGSSDTEGLQKRMGCKVGGFKFDSEYASYLKYPFSRKHGLDAIAHTFFPEYADYKEIPAMFAERMPDGKLNYATVPLSWLVPYNCADATLSKLIELKATSGRAHPHYFEDHAVSLPYVEVMTDAAHTVARMEKHGPLLDTKHHALVTSAVPPHVRRLTGQLREMAGDPKFNPGAHQQVSKVLYDVLKFQPVDGQRPRSTSKEDLAILADTTNHPFPKLQSEWRVYNKIETTYLAGSLRSAEEHDGEVRCKWWMTGTATTRFASGGERSSDEALMNLQNWHGNPFVKNLLVSDLRWRQLLDGLSPKLLDMDVFFVPDYSQAELRMLAESASDQLLLEQFISGADIHSLVGHSLTGWSVEKIKGDDRIRRLVKNMHFGIVYGIGRGNIYNYVRSKGGQTTESKITKLYDRYFQTYEGVRRFIELMREFVAEHGYVYNIFGFRRPLSALDASRKTSVQNQAINTPIQSASHTLMLAAFALLHHHPERYPALRRVIMEVHDSFVFRVKLRDIVAAHKQAHQLMCVDTPQYIERAFNFKFRVPIVSDAKVGFRYGSLIKYEGESPKDTVDSWLKYNTEVDKKCAKEFKLAT